ncbi:MAG: MFS transporter, partial [Miltoncostaeaceae bacterium]
MSESTDRNPSDTWLDRWEPEDNDFWESTGKSRAWRTLTITTSNLVMAFIVWFVVSALVVRLDDVGFDLSSSQLFWLAAMPGLSAGTLRIFHSFAIPVFGTRHVVSISTALLLLP